MNVGLICTRNDKRHSSDPERTRRYHERLHATALSCADPVPKSLQSIELEAAPAQSRAPRDQSLSLTLPRKKARPNRPDQV